MKRALSNPGEMLGLTLCYEDEDEEGNTEIFIDDIAPSDLAAREGRLRLGDQIIQVRGKRDKGNVALCELRSELIILYLYFANFRSMVRG